MKNSILYLVMLSIVFLYGGITDLHAQDDMEDESPYWYVSSYKLDWAKIDSLEKMVKKYTIPVVEEAKKTGVLMDYRVLVHHTGDGYNVIIMRQYPSWDDMDESSGFGPAMEKLIPDEAERDQINETFNWIYEGSDHKDNIYREITYSQE